MTPFRVAMVTCPASTVDPTQNEKRLLTYVQRAARNKAKIICFPECSLSGYAPKIRPQLAQSLNGRWGKLIRELAQAYDITILAGFTERSHQKYFISQMIGFPEGTSQIYRKLHLAPPEQKIVAPGGRARVFTEEKISFGVELCYDAHFPLLTTRLAQKGAQIIFMPHASPNGTSAEKYHSWLRHLPARAYDNSVYVLATNQCGKNEAGLTFPAVIMAIGPDGRIVQKYTGQTEKMVLLDLNLDWIDEIRSHPMKYFLANHRSNI